MFPYMVVPVVEPVEVVPVPPEEVVPVEPVVELPFEEVVFPDDVVEPDLEPEVVLVVEVLLVVLPVEPVEPVEPVLVAEVVARCSASAMEFVLVKLNKEIEPVTHKAMNK